MSLFYDLHIHSALSPCGDEDMTPNNIVNMSYIKGLDIIAITDHNSCGNIRPVMEVAAGKIKVVPGMEITTSEEVHVLCYFPDVESAEDMGRLIYQHLPDMRNNPEIFGRQLLLDRNDEIIGVEEKLLVNAVDLDIYEVAEETRRRGGLFVPAHIDRTSYSITSNLGFMPPDLTVDGVEITSKGLAEFGNQYEEIGIISSSDAHYLEDISEKENMIDKNNKYTQKIYEFLCKF